MLKRILVLVVILSIGFWGYSQHKISGIIIDEESGKPVPDAFVIQENGTAAVSDSSGQFSINLKNIPAKILVSHVSYGQSEINIEKLPQGILVIRIQKMISNLEEVQISAERMRILTEKVDFSLQDYAIDSTHLWMLGYINNRPKNGRLWLANLFGDTLRSIPVDKPEKLYRDVFGNIHLFINDSVFQLFGTTDTIGFVDGLSRNEFQRILNPIKGYFAGKLIYQSYLPQQEGLHTYYYSLSDSVPQFLTCIRDTAAEILQEDEFVYGYAASVMNSLNGTGGLAGLKIWHEMLERKRKMKEQVYRRVNAPLVYNKNKLYILNFYKDSLLVYNSSGFFVDSKSVSFHKDLTLFRGINYKELDFMGDQSTDRVFCLERENTGWILSEINTTSGALEKIPLPDFPGMTGITISNNAVYFLYPEKSYPFYSRLYRYQL